jgi:hypothetical protein
MNLPPELHSELEGCSDIIVEALISKFDDNTRDVLVFFDSSKHKAIACDRTGFIEMCECRGIPCEGLYNIEETPGCSSFWVVALKDNKAYSVIMTIPPEAIGTA